MHRLSNVVRPYQRSISSLSQVLSRPSSSPIPPPRPSPSLSQKQQLQQPVIVDFFEDDLLNELFAPTITISEPDLTHSSDIPPSNSTMRDSFMYGPKEQAAYNRQITLEEETVDNAVERFRKMTELASNRGDVITHRSANDLLVAWYHPFILALRSMQQQQLQEQQTPKRPRSSGRRKAGEEACELLSTFPADAVAIIVIHTLLSSMMREAANGLPLTRAAHLVAEAVRAEVNLKRIVELRRAHEKELELRDESFASSSSMPPTVKSILDRAKKAASMQPSTTLASAVNYATACADEREQQWDVRKHIMLGTKLIDIFMNSSKVMDKDGNFVPAIIHSLRSRKSDNVKVGILQFSDSAMGILKENVPVGLSDYINPKQQPMLVEPKPWISPSDGGYLRCQCYLVRRLPGSHREVEKLLQGADLTKVYKGLNALGEQEWRVNLNVLEPAQLLWDNGGGIAGLVTKTNCHVPDRKKFLAAEYETYEKKKSEREMMLCAQENESEDEEEEDDEEECEDQNDEFDEKKALRRLRSERRKAQKLNRELVSMRADTEHRMRQAQRFSGEDRIWLPHNVDFRGRAYPIPVHLQHMGCDLTRALLTFSKPGIELGERGVYWLKIHLANLLGADKKSLDQRIDVAENEMSRAIQVGRNPTSDENLEWWSRAEDPFQLLAACCELAQACGKFGGEQSMLNYHSSLPVSMDGSCNGLQHYAALGRDIEGGTQVNLVPNDSPQDVYTGIAELVSAKVDKMAEEGDKFGMLMKGKVSRKVVKQTVMTSVYGVTPVGARQQIMNRLVEVDGIPEEEIFSSALKLAHLTLSSLGDIFEGATETMDWLYECAKRISKHGHKVEWTTPIGLPVMQPYRRCETKIIRTLMQRVTLQKSGEHSPVSTLRQRSAFPPNYVHSIDSAHMLLTAIGCHEKGLNFAAVHDSFWTNAAHVDVMNEVLREQFIELHQRDLLAQLRESFLIRYGNMDLPNLPKRGQLDLNVVRHSPYFFS